MVDYCFLKVYLVGQESKKNSHCCKYVDLWEIWDKKTYEGMMKDDWDEFDQLAHEVMKSSSGD